MSRSSCRESLTEFTSEAAHERHFDIDGMIFTRWEGQKKLGAVCQRCGWWKAQDYWTFAGPSGIIENTKRGCAALKNLDLEDVKTPLEEVTQYLCAKYDARYSVDPGLWENVVGAVFSELGYDVVVTGHSGDGGIDVVLNDGPLTIGVQVKRYKHSIRS